MLSIHRTKESLLLFFGKLECERLSFRHLEIFLPKNLQLIAKLFLKTQNKLIRIKLFLSLNFLNFVSERGSFETLLELFYDGNKRLNEPKHEIGLR